VDGNERSWEDALHYGFISAGGGSWYSNTLNLLNVGDRVWVKTPGKGFVGFGEVTAPSQSAADFQIEVDGALRPVLEVLTKANYHREFVEDPEKAEYFVGMKWVRAVALNEAINEVGMFGNQNSVCKPTTPKWRTTVERLKQRWNLD